MNRLKLFFTKNLSKIGRSMKGKNSPILAMILIVGSAFAVAILAWAFGLFEVPLGITLVIIEVPLGVFGAILVRTLLNESRKDAEAVQRLQDEGIHKKRLTNKIYKKLTSVQLHFIKDKAILQVERFEKWEPWHKDVEPENLWTSIDRLKESEYPNFDYALDHLKEYDFCTFWNHTKLLVDVINSGSRPNELENYKNTIQEALRQFRAELTKLTARLEAGEKLKGICDLGY